MTATKRRKEKLTERFEVEWCEHCEVVDGDHDPDLDRWDREYFGSLENAIEYAKHCRFDLHPVSICRQVLADEICGDENFGPRWEYTDEGVLIDVMGNEVIDYRN